MRRDGRIMRSAVSVLAEMTALPAIRAEHATYLRKSKLCSLAWPCLQLQC